MAQQPKIVNKQFNSPIGLYSEQNIREVLDRETQMLANGAVGINFHNPQTTKPGNLHNSAVLRMLEEEESKRGVKRVAWPPPRDAEDDYAEQEPIQAQGGAQYTSQVPSRSPNTIQQAPVANNYQQPPRPVTPQVYQQTTPLYINPPSPAFNQPLVQSPGSPQPIYPSGPQPYQPKHQQGRQQYQPVQAGFQQPAYAPQPQAYQNRPPTPQAQAYQQHPPTPQPQAYQQHPPTPQPQAFQPQPPQPQQAPQQQVKIIPIQIEQQQPQNQVAAPQQQQQNQFRQPVSPPPAKKFEPPPTIITLRPQVPISQRPAPVFSSQPATATLKGGKNLRGDLKWPPENVRERMEAEERHKVELQQGPALKPRRANKDYSSFFAAHALNSAYPGYKIPPGTQYYEHHPVM